MAERKKQSLLNGAIILVISTLVVKVIGLCFKMPLGSMLGLVGYGYFTSVYAIYTPIYSISMAGLPIAVSRMVAEDVALNHYREARMTLKTARKIFLLVGTAGTLLMVIISIPYAAFISDIRNLPAMIAVAPSIFFCCYVSAYRGYYEGLRNMIPTAISQVIEALGKLVIGLVFAKLIMSYGESAYNSAVAAGSATATVFGKEVSSLNEAFSVTYPWAAAGAILGVTLGSLLSLIYLGIRHRTKGDGITRLELVNSPKPPANHEIAKNMITIAVPILLSSLVLNATNLIDAVTIQNRLLHAIESGQDTIYNLYKQCIDADVASGTLNLSDSKGFMSYLYGAYNTAVDFKNLVPMITVSLGVSALPALAEAWTMKDKAAVKSAVNTSARRYRHGRARRAYTYSYLRPRQNGCRYPDDSAHGCRLRLHDCVHVHFDPAYEPPSGGRQNGYPRKNNARLRRRQNNLQLRPRRHTGHQLQRRGYRNSPVLCCKCHSQCHRRYKSH